MTAKDNIKALTYDVSATGSEEEGKEVERGKVEDTEKMVEKAEKGEESPKTLEREVAATLTALNTPTKPKQKRKRQTSMYFRARKSTRIKK